jgi:predicted naringenin-chalcone synthase
MRIHSFRLVRPRYEARQEQILAWLADVHTRAARAVARDAHTFDEGAFHDRMKRLVRHVCCGADRIATRGYSAFSAPDGSTPPEDELLLYDVDHSPTGAGTAARTDYYAREVESVFARLYAHEHEPPHDLVHVTCTGYLSPSGAQRLVSAKGWGERTRVTHAYHMGCYAAVPALRIALGLGALEAAGVAGARGREREYRADVVHTELCTLHFDPTIHTPEQLVVQSLFADGSIRYTVSSDGEGPGFRVLSLREILSGGSEDAMQWSLGDHGMRMTLSREIPGHVARTIRPFVAALFERAGLDFANERHRSVFAVHPGGPKIIDAVREAMELEEAQVAPARRVLSRFGNMSSATVPHIWSELLDDPRYPAGTLVASFAFGPGLTICGALLRKQ